MINLIRNGVKFMKHRKMLNFIPDEMYLKLVYWESMGKRLDLNNPRTFSEKLQWLKLNNRNPMYSIMVDKYKVKKYVANKIGEEHIIPTLGVWDSFDAIEFDLLPEQFVLKCTHDSGGLIICKSKASFDKKQAKRKINASMKTKYYFSGREWPYKNVKPHIIAEEYLFDSNSQGKDLIDYKFYCFNGMPQFCQVITDRSMKEKIDFFDMNWVHQEFNGLALPNSSYGFYEGDIIKPSTFDQMKKAAEILSKDVPFLRIDLYEVDRKMYFGEITFYPASGFGIFKPDKWNYILGDMIKI